MIVGDALFEVLTQGESSLTALMGNDTRLKANQQARMRVIASTATSNTYLTPREGNEIVFCLRQVLTMADND